MEAIVTLLRSLAVVALVSAGIAAIVQLARPRDVLLRFSLALFILSLFVPYAGASIGRNLDGFSCNPTGATTVGRGHDVSTGAAIAIVIGHVALAVVLLARRLRGPDAARNRAAEIERARARERPRLPADPGDDAS